MLLRCPKRTYMIHGLLNRAKLLRDAKEAVAQRVKKDVFAEVRRGLAFRPDSAAEFEHATIHWLAMPKKPE